MHSLAEDNQRRCEELHGVVHKVKNLVNPFVDHIFPLRDNLDGILERLANVSPLLRVGVFGPPKSGKSTILSALCGEDIFPRREDDQTWAPVTLQHVQGIDPTLKVQQTGKCLAIGVEKVQGWIRDENPKWEQLVNQGMLKSRANNSSRLGRNSRELPVGFQPMQLELEIPCLKSYKEIPVQLQEAHPSATFFTSKKSNISSRYIKIHTAVNWDAIFYVIDYNMLNTPDEDNLFKEIVDSINPKSLLHYKDQIHFVVNKSDELINMVNQVDDVHAPDVDPKFEDVPACQAYVENLILRRVGFKPQPYQLTITSAKVALFSRVVRRKPTIDQLYEFSEIGRGSRYMQTIDRISEEELRSLSKLRAVDVEKGTNFENIDNMVRILDVNSGRAYLTSVLGEISHQITQYQSILDQSIPLLEEDNATKEDEKKTLVDEYHYIVDRLKKTTSMVQDMRSSMKDMVTAVWHEFWLSRINELNMVFEGKDEIHFESRQTTAIYEIERGLRRFMDFLPRYQRDRIYMEGKLYGEEPPLPEASHLDSIAKQREAAEVLNSTIFVRKQTSEVLAVLEKERFEKAVDFNGAVMLHIKDELKLLYPQLETILAESRGDLVTLICSEAESADMWSRTERALGRAFDTEKLRIALGDKLKLLKGADTRDLNNTLRDGPTEVGHVMLSIPVAPEMLELRAALVKSWRLYANRTDPAKIVRFDGQGMNKAIQEALHLIIEYVGEYATMLRDGIQQEQQEINDNIVNIQEVEAQQGALPRLALLAADVFQDIKNSSVYELKPEDIYG